MAERVRSDLTRVVARLRGNNPGTRGRRENSTGDRPPLVASAAPARSRSAGAANSRRKLTVVSTLAAIIAGEALRLVHAQSEATGPDPGLCPKASDDGLQAHAGLAERLAGRDRGSAGHRAHERRCRARGRFRLEPRRRATEPISQRSSSTSPGVAPARRCSLKVGVVDAQRQAMLQRGT